jgi:hypothetical protein
MILIAFCTHPAAQAIALNSEVSSVTDGCFRGWYAEDGSDVPEGVHAHYGKADASRWFPALPWHRLEVPPAAVVPPDEPADDPPAVVIDEPSAPVVDEPMPAVEGA